jgi:hypothetical protein
MTQIRDPDGLRLLIDRGWTQEVVHQLVLRELLERTGLAAALGLWQGATAPRVWYEPYRGLFDLALADTLPRVLIELKVGADVGEHQRRRQRERAAVLACPRVYVLLGTAYFAALDEPDARNIGVPELAVAIRTSLPGNDGSVGDLGRAYLERLEADAVAWQAEHDPTSASGLDLFRLYVEMASAWPVEVRPTKVTHPGGPDWIINADAWTKSDVPSWEPATFYWEMVNGRTRFKVHWEGEIAHRLGARTAYREALERAAKELGEPVGRTRTRTGKYMTALELASDARDEILVGGRVSPERSRALYDRATALFRRALELLPEGEGR